jgi:hypothetical protein
LLCSCFLSNHAQNDARQNKGDWMTKCANCGTQNNGSAKFCKSCGTALAQAIPSPEQPVASSNCSACASPVAPGARFCKKCGTGLTDRVALAAEPAARVAESASVPPARPAHDTASASPVLPDKPVTEVSLAARPGVDAVTEAPAIPVAGTVPVDTLPITEAPVSPRLVDAAPVSTPPMSGSAPNGRTKGSPYLIVGIGVGVLVSLVSAGAYWWSGSHKSTDAAPQADASALRTPAPIPAPPVAPAESVSSPAPERSTSSGANATAQPAASAAASPQLDRPPATPAAEVVDALRATKPAQPKRAAPTPRPELRPALRFTHADGLNEKVATMLSKGDGYIASQQYDKAVATGESVLVLDPDNAAAKALIRRAKARQLDVLKSGTSLD